MDTKRIKITSRCNQRCLFCDSQGGKEYSRPRLLREIANRKRASKLHITGGEPTLCRDLPAYIRAARAAGYRRIHLLTNGLRLANKAYCRELQRAGLDEVVLAFQHADDGLSDYVCASQGGQTLRSRAFKNLNAIGMGVMPNILVFSLNYGVLPDLVRGLSEKFSVKQVMFSFIEPDCTNVRARPWLVPPIGPALMSLRRALAVCREKGIRCHLPYHGALPACVYAKAGIRLPRQAVVEGADFGSGRVRGRFCSACRENKTCLGFPEEYYKECVGLLGGARMLTAKPPLGGCAPEARVYPINIYDSGR